MIRIDRKDITLEQLRALWWAPVEVEIAADRLQNIEESHEAVKEVVNSGKTVYGINTGFGLLANTRIAKDQLTRLQSNLVLSHATGVGESLPAPVVRLILLLKIASLSQGYSGIRRTTIERLLLLLNNDALPVIPGQGSVGASGDLAPLAHMSAALIGAGKMDFQGQRQPASNVLEKLGVKPLDLGPKEGLALLNGTQVSTALALAGLFASENVFAAAMVAGAISVDAAMGSDTPYDHRIHAIRRHSGQIKVAARLRQLMEGSEIRASHLSCDRVQDPYCLRCMPQVMGACLDQMVGAAGTLAIEANAVTDNPLVFLDSKDILSGGNFHAEPVAFAADNMALVLAEIGNMSERRTAMLIDPHMSGLPAFLVADSGLNSGFMIAQVTAAALASENKTRAFPASVDSIPTSANQEDHVSMATHGARRLQDMAANARNIVAIELLAAAQGLEFHRPKTSSEVLENAVAELRTRVPRLDKDRFFADDIEKVENWVAKGGLNAPVASLLPSYSDD